MQYDLQKGSLLKRIAAALFDLILVAILATGFLWVGNEITDYDAHQQQLSQITQQYAEQYGVRTDMTNAEYYAMTEEERAAYDAAAEQANLALNENEEAVRLYNLVMNLILTTISLSILLAMVLLGFVVPLLFGNGQSLGKKIFGLCVIRRDGVKISPVQLFARSVLGKYAVGTMIPVYALIMLMMGTLGGLLLLMVMALLIVQIISVVATKENRSLADLLAGTIVADFSSQMIFETTEDLITYQKKVAAERSSRQPY